MRPSLEQTYVSFGQIRNRLSAIKEENETIIEDFLESKHVKSTASLSVPELIELDEEFLEINLAILREIQTIIKSLDLRMGINPQHQPENGE